MTNTAMVTRLEVIDADLGRVYTATPVHITLSYQDDGRTLKVFVLKLKQGEVWEGEKGQAE